MGPYFDISMKSSHGGSHTSESGRAEEGVFRWRFILKVQTSIANTTPSKLG